MNHLLASLVDTVLHPLAILIYYFPLALLTSVARGA